MSTLADHDLNLAVNLDGADADDQDRRAEALAGPMPDGRVLICCATTNPIRFGSSVEWLDMAGADLTLLNSGRAPLLISHGHDLESLVGIVERAWVDDDRLLVVARLGGTERAREAMRLVQDRVLVNASMGFYCTSAEESDGTRAQRIGWWRPHEVSLVTSPRNWGSRVLDLRVPVRVRAMLARQAAEKAGGTPDTWRSWAASAAGPLAANAGLDPHRFECAMTAAVEAELARLAAEAAAEIGVMVDAIHHQASAGPQPS